MKVLYITATAQLLAGLVGESPSSAFSFRTHTLKYRSRESGPRSRGVYSKPEEYDDGIGDIANFKTSSEGQDLAAEFYESLQKRKETEASSKQATKDTPPVDLEESFSLSSSSTPTSSMGRTDAGSLFEKNDLLDNEERKSTTSKRKFTGRPMDGQDYFGGSYAETKNNVREEMMRREYNLVSGATGATAFTFQAGLALFMLAFFIYVGLTGGIVSGEEAAQMNFSGDEIEFEQIIPLPRDSDNSVWI